MRLRVVVLFIVSNLVPILVTAGLNLGPRLGYFTLLPLSMGVEREYGNYALLLGVAGALVTSASFGREAIRFDLPEFVSTALVGLVTVTPFIVGRTGLTFGLPPRYLDVVITFAYLGFFITVGVLVGGCWSVVVKILREGREREWQSPPS